MPASMSQSLPNTATGVGVGGTSPLWTPNRAAANRLMVVNHGMLHIVGVPLLILGSLAVGFVLVYLKEVLVPFVVSVFIVYLLRPLVNLLTTPFSKVFGVCFSFNAHTQPLVTNIRGRMNRAGAYSRIGGVPDTPDNDSAGNSTAQSAAAPPRRRGPSPPKYHRTVRGVLARVSSSIVPCCSNQPASAVVPPSSGAGRASPNPQNAHGEDECGCCCGPCRITRCPRWFAILVSLCVASAVLAGLVLLVADAIQRFHEESLPLYIQQAGHLAEELQDWFAVFGIHIEASAALDVIKNQVSVVNLVQTTLTIIIDGVGTMILILLLVLYLLAEQNQHAPGSLRAKVDSQIQRYVVIKTAISAGQGIVVFFILGYLLDVRMAHLFGVFHFVMNYIPTAGPIIATVVPMPIVILDPNLGLTAKIAAFAAPTAVHMVIGNFVEPLVFGSSMELHPVTVLMALALFYAIWGVAGAILAVPITAVLRIILSAVDHPYAHIVINILEGRLSAATQQFDSALDGSLDVDVDVEDGMHHHQMSASRTRSAGTASETGIPADDAGRPESVSPPEPEDAARYLSQSSQAKRVMFNSTFVSNDFEQGSNPAASGSGINTPVSRETSRDEQTIIPVAQRASASTAATPQRAPAPPAETRKDSDDSSQNTWPEFALPNGGDEKSRMTKRQP